MKNILMVDLETTGTEPGCCILSIGAAGYDKNGEYKEFYARLNYNQLKVDGFTDSKQTIEWLQKQDESARLEAFGGTADPVEVAFDFDNFVHNNFIQYKNFEAWCCGLDFDFPILRHFMARYCKAISWPFYLQRDYRTIKALFPCCKAAEQNSAKHTALEDAKAQLRGLMAFYAERNQ